MATSWVEEGALADMKNRLDKLRVDQSKQKDDDEPGKKDTLKILQSKFGSPVYDPTSPLQKAYDRRCARTGRRKSIEFEDLYLTRGSGQLQLPASPASPKNRSGSAAKKHPPLLRTSSGMDYSSQLSQLLSSSGGGSGGPSSPTRSRKSSDPTHSRKWDLNGHSKSRSHGTEGGGGGHKVSQGESEGHKGHGHRGQGHRGILSVTVSEEDKKVIDKKLARIGGGGGGGGGEEEGDGEGKSHHVTSTQRRRKISKSGAKH